MSDRHLLRVVVVCGIGAILCFAALAFCGCASSRTGKSLNVAVGVSASADYLTTRAAINSGKGYEGNPLMGQGPVRQFLLKAGQVGGIVWLTHWSDEQGRTRLAHVVRLMAIAVNTGLAIHNAGVLR